jgi:glycosidase
MKNCRSIFFFLGFIAITACSSEETAVGELVYGDAIVGLASPAQLNYGTTRIYLLDYFEDAAGIDSVAIADSADYSFLADSAIILVNDFEAHRGVSTINVVYKGVAYQIPLFRSRSTAFNFSYESPSQNVQEVALKGNFNGWNHKATILRNEGDVWTTELILPPGLYEYRVVEDGREMLDPNNPNKKDNGQGGFNSTFRVGSAHDRPSISTFGMLGDSIVVFYPEAMHSPLILWENHQLTPDQYTRRSNRIAISVPSQALKMDRSHIRVYGCADTERSNDLLIPLAKGKPVRNTKDLDRTDKQTYAMYFMMVDRFVNGEKDNDKPVNDPEILPPANYYGGDIAGVLDKVNDGYFEKLGTNTIWLSPITQNPLGAYGLWDMGGVRSKFSGYHGYWPISSSQVDFRFGTADELRQLTEAAHKKDFNVLLDYVANHVHQEHPVYQQHPDWATDLYLPDGTLNTERWDEYRLTTWFDTFMPTLDLERADIVEAMTDSALFWFENYAIDGFRHDATKHIAHGFWRTLTRKLKYRVAVPENRTIYQIGETYGNPELIGSYIGSGMLDSQFDFNLYDAAIATFASSEGGMENLHRVLMQSLTAYGDHHLMGNISGNQDRARFISYADGSVSFAENAKLAGWTRKIEISDPIGYSRLAMLHAFNFTVPGIPVIYYGDEIGMPGANDPDNRRMMRFGKDLSRDEQQMLEKVTAIANLRKDNMALIYGDLLTLHINNTELAYIRNYFDQSAIVLFNTSAMPVTITVEVPQHYNIENLKGHNRITHEVSGRTVTIELPPVSFQILTN